MDRDNAATRKRSEEGFGWLARALGGLFGGTKAADAEGTPAGPVEREPDLPPAQAADGVDTARPAPQSPADDGAHAPAASPRTSEFTPKGAVTGQMEPSGVTVASPLAPHAPHGSAGPFPQPSHGSPGQPLPGNPSVTPPPETGEPLTVGGHGEVPGRVPEPGTTGTAVPPLVPPTLNTPDQVPGQIPQPTATGTAVPPLMPPTLGNDKTPNLAPQQTTPPDHLAPDRVPPTLGNDKTPNLAPQQTTPPDHLAPDRVPPTLGNDKTPNLAPQQTTPPDHLAPDRVPPTLGNDKTPNLAPQQTTPPDHLAPDRVPPTLGNDKTPNLAPQQMTPPDHLAPDRVPPTLGNDKTPNLARQQTSTPDHLAPDRVPPTLGNDKTPNLAPQQTTPPDYLAPDRVPPTLGNDKTPNLAPQQTTPPDHLAPDRVPPTLGNDKTPNLAPQQTTPPDHLAPDRVPPTLGNDKTPNLAPQQMTTPDHLAPDRVPPTLGNDKTPNLAPHIPQILGADTSHVTEDTVLTAGGKLDIVDPDRGEAAFTAQPSAAGAHGTFSVKPDGTWTYQLDNSQPAVQQLGRGEHLTDLLMVTSVDGTRHALTVEIRGVIDAPALTVTATQGTDHATATAGNNATATLAATEDHPIGLAIATSLVDKDPTEHLPASLTIDGVPAGATLNHGVADSRFPGRWTVNSTELGSLELTPPKDFTGPITLKVSEFVVDLSPGEGAPAASAEATLHINVAPVQEPAVIGGTDAGSLTEDTNLQTGHLQTGGALTITDVDAGEAAFTPVAGAAGAGRYGTFTLDAQGHWNYTADNAQTAIDQLGPKDTLTDTFTVTSVDGTTHDITVTIAGKNDRPVITTAVRQTDGDVTEDNAAHVTATGTLTATDIDNATGDLTWKVVGGGHGTFGSVSIDAHTGQWTYTLDNGKPETQQLGEGQTQTDQIQIGVLDPNHGYSLRTLHFEVHGTNDAPIITIGKTDTDSGAVTEDAGTTTATGSLSSTDVDGTDGASSLVWTVDTSTTGTYGTLSVDQSGGWTYTLDNGRPATQALTLGQPATETLRVIVTDPHGGQDTHEVTVTVTGTPDGAQIAGADSVTLLEDKAVTSGNLTAGGTLTVTDADTGESAFVPIAGATGAGTYGTFTLSADGQWTYTADNSQQAVQEIGPGQSLTDTLQVTSVDGTTHDITVTIAGAIDAPTVGAAVRATVAVPEHAVVDVDAAGTIQSTGFKLHGFGLGEGYETAGGDLVDPGTASARVAGGIASGGSLGVDAPLTQEVLAANPGYSGTGVNTTVGTPRDNVLDSATTSATDKSQQAGETLVIELDGMARQATVSLGDLGGHGDKVHWTAYAADHSVVAEGEFESQPTATLSGNLTTDLSISAGSPFSYIALTAEAPAPEVIPAHTATAADARQFSNYHIGDLVPEQTEQFTTNVSVLSVRAEVLRYETPLDISGATGDTGDTDQSVSWRIDGLRSGTLSAGTENPNGSWTVTGAEAQGLTVVHTGTEQVQVTAIATDSGTGDTAQSQPVAVTVDPGGAIYTVITGAPVGRTDEDATTPIGGDLDIDTNAAVTPSFVAGDQQGQYGTLHVDTDGRWTYVVDNTAAQGLRSDTGTDTFTVHTTDGATTELSVFVEGQDDASVLVDTAGTGVRTPAAVVGGHLAQTDTDTPAPRGSMYLIEGGQRVSGTGSSPGMFTELDGTYGTFKINAQSGDWTYTVDPSKTATLAPGQVVDESVSAKSQILGTSESATLDLHVAVDDQGRAQVRPGSSLAPAQPSHTPATISGVDSDTLTEDTGLAGGDLAAGGQLTITDPDLGEAAFSPVTGTAGAGQYGRFTLTADGLWTYNADNSQPSVQDLGPGQSVTEMLKVTSVDGTTHDITVTIHGTIDAPTMATTVGTSTFAPSHAEAVASGTTVASTGFILHGFGYGEAYRDGTGNLLDPTAGQTGLGVGRGGTFGVESTSGVPTDTAGNANKTAGYTLDTTADNAAQQSANEKGETLVVELEGLSRSAHVSMEQFGPGGEITIGHNDQVHWAVYDENRQIVDEGTIVRTAANATGGHVELQIDTARPFAYISLEAESPPPELTSGGKPDYVHTNVEVKSVQAELIRYETPLDLSGTPGDTSDTDQSTAWRIEGLQQAVLSVGSRNPDGSWTVTEAEAQGLKVLHSSPQTLHVTAVATDAGTGETATSAPVDVTVDPHGAHYTVITGSPVARIDEAATAPVSGDLGIDTDKATVPGFVQSTQTSQYGTFTIDGDGQWSFTVDRSGTETLLADTTQSFTVHATDGTTRDLSIVIEADNDPGVLSEASRQPSTGAAHAVGGQLGVTDPDDLSAHYMFLLPGARPSASHDYTVDGSYGTFHMDMTSGSWTYSPDPARLAQIPAGHTAVETFDVYGRTPTSTTNTLELRLEVNDKGDARVAQVVHDVDAEMVTEDDQRSMQGGNLSQHGTLHAVDSADPLPTAPVAGAYGTFTLTADGHWTYTADNSQAAIQQLDHGDSLTDSVTVTTSGGATYAMEVTIRGADEVAPSHPDAPDTTLTEDMTITLDADGRAMNSLGGVVDEAGADISGQETADPGFAQHGTPMEAEGGGDSPSEGHFPSTPGIPGDNAMADMAVADEAADVPAEPTPTRASPLDHYLQAVGGNGGAQSAEPTEGGASRYLEAIGAGPADEAPDAHALDPALTSGADEMDPDADDGQTDDGPAPPDVFDPADAPQEIHDEPQPDDPSLYN
ncbi:VCBS domain-containing protein [Acuticoccus sp. MNP-M23]|uniref:VCBS domain-containing protein n=1 Tax=Acuticoccus sp. MNP-M23 TaxID=3072793 RepID=UPI0028154CD2|nr:VCBS domain-containing protein [Acuticoccus sp. MNP-M23]WMS41327.1 VCBS domain-containing protein [Acuticoccus sp. MNP-M23]